MPHPQPWPPQPATAARRNPLHSARPAGYHHPRRVPPSPRAPTRTRSRKLARPPPPNAATPCRRARVAARRVPPPPGRRERCRVRAGGGRVPCPASRREWAAAARRRHGCVSAHTGGRPRTVAWACSPYLSQGAAHAVPSAYRRRCSCRAVGHPHRRLRMRSALFAPSRVGRSRGPLSRMPLSPPPVPPHMHTPPRPAIAPPRLASAPASAPRARSRPPFRAARVRAPVSAPFCACPRSGSRFRPCPALVPASVLAPLSPPPPPPLPALVASSSRPPAPHGSARECAWVCRRPRRRGRWGRRAGMGSGPPQAIGGWWVSGSSGRPGPGASARCGGWPPSGASGFGGAGSTLSHGLLGGWQPSGRSGSCGPGGGSPPFGRGFVDIFDLRASRGTR